MSATRWKEIFDDFGRTLHRELRIALTRTPAPEKWVFVVGCYNSGTTLLAEILGTHPEISALPSEGQYLTDQFPRDHEIGLSRMWVEREDLYRLDASDPGPNVERLKREWGMRLDLSKRILLEKTPANSARMLWFQEHFENAHFIAIVRDGYAVAEGITRKAKPLHRKAGWPLEMAAAQWARSNEVILNDSEKLRKFHLLTYEDFTEGPVEEIRKICEFLNLPESDAIDLRRNWSVHERKEPISNLNHRSFDRLTDGDIAIINKAAGSLLKKLGYYRTQKELPA